MELKDIASVSGKGGLFRIVAPAKSGVILESLDAAKTKLVASAQHRISVLHEISIYTTTAEGTVPLEDVLKKIHSVYGETLKVNPDSSAEELRAFILSVLPEYDADRVYVSDLKKLVRWYPALVQHAPEVLRAAAAPESK